jgi:Low affinity iron permease
MAMLTAAGDDRPIPDGPLVQNTENGDTAVLHLTLDKLIRVSESARDKPLDLEDLTQVELEHIKGGLPCSTAMNPTLGCVNSPNIWTQQGQRLEIKEAKEKITSVAIGKF